MVATTIFVVKWVQNCLAALFEDDSAGSAKTYSASSSVVFLFRVERNKVKSEYRYLQMDARVRQCLTDIVSCAWRITFSRYVRFGCHAATRVG